jgi:predicted O-linked N-acetylglucosamine transferase (SPINDLY family)
MARSPNIPKRKSPIGRKARPQPSPSLELVQIEKLVAQGLALHQQGKLPEAKAIYDQVLKKQPQNFMALQLMGAFYLQTKNNLQAIEFLSQAIAINPQFAPCYNNIGLAFKEIKRLDEALASYDHAVRIKPDYAEAYSNRGVVLQELKRLDEALASYDHAVRIKPDYAMAYYNRGVTLQELKRLDEALASYDQAIRIKPDSAETYSNRGNALKELKRLEEALASYDQAIRIKPDSAETYSNRGNALKELKRLEEALASYDQAIRIKPDLAEAYYNRGVTLQELKRLDEALASYDQAVAIKPDLDWLYGDRLHIKMHLCDWSQFEAEALTLIDKIQSKERASKPFPVLALIDDPKLQKLSSEILTQSKYLANSALGAIPKHINKEKIRIGYYSADFRNHAVSILMAQLFELHDKNRFEIIAFAFGGLSSDSMRERLCNAFDEFIDVNKKSDMQVAQLSRELGVDIAVDLGGFTGGSRTNIFSYRAAPIQLGYIGYLGTMGAKYMDYLVADKVIIPTQSTKHYSEKIVYLPSYQVNDRKRVISEKRFTRQELGLSDESFVFCCLNNNYKITPTTFDSWMRILHAVECSVLWLYVDNELAKVNLQKEALLRGIATSRLIFASRISAPDYLSRYLSADLFLDTLPYNAGTTASYALWAGLPVLTLIGQSFASRVAASLLTAIDLPELITQTPEAYEALAIDLATHPEKLEAIKEKLSKNRLTTPLFDTHRFTQNIEVAYEKMYARYQADLPADHIHVL